jgi:hypothetical protein
MTMTEMLAYAKYQEAQAKATVRALSGVRSEWTADDINAADQDLHKALVHFRICATGTERA